MLPSEFLASLSYATAISVTREKGGGGEGEARRRKKRKGVNRGEGGRDGRREGGEEGRDEGGEKESVNMFRQYLRVSVLSLEGKTLMKIIQNSSV